MAIGPPVSGIVFELECFEELHTCRVNGLLPVLAVQEYADRHGLGPEFVYVIRKMDEAFLGELNAQAETKNKNPARTEARQTAGGSGGWPAA